MREREHPQSRPALRLPRALLALPRQLLGKTLNERVAGESLEQGLLNPLPSRSPCRRADGDTGEETDNQHEEKREDVLSGKPFWEQRCQWPHKAHYRLHGLEQQQDDKVNGSDDEQAANQRVNHEFAQLCHILASLDVVSRSENVDNL